MKTILMALSAFLFMSETSWASTFETTAPVIVQFASTDPNVSYIAEAIYTRLTPNAPELSTRFVNTDITEVIQELLKQDESGQSESSTNSQLRNAVMTSGLIEKINREKTAELKTLSEQTLLAQFELKQFIVDWTLINLALHSAVDLKEADIERLVTPVAFRFLRTAQALNRRYSKESLEQNQIYEKIFHYMKYIADELPSRNHLNFERVFHKAELKQSAIRFNRNPDEYQIGGYDDLFEPRFMSVFSIAMLSYGIYQAVVHPDYSQFLTLNSHAVGALFVGLLSGADAIYEMGKIISSVNKDRKAILQPLDPWKQACQAVFGTTAIPTDSHK